MVDLQTKRGWIFVLSVLGIFAGVAFLFAFSPLMDTNEHNVDLHWNASTSSVIGYHVYRSENSVGPYTRITKDPIACCKFRDKEVKAGKTYYYVVTAVNVYGTESLNSNQASAQVPKP